MNTQGIRSALHRAANTKARRRVLSAAAVVALASSGVAAVAATDRGAGGKSPLVFVPPVAVEQAGGISSLPALPALPALAMPTPNAAITPQTTNVDYRPAQTWGLGSVASGIPAQAMEAYQTAAQLLADADSGCGLDWALLAGIGKVESDHGRWGGNRLDAAANAVPGIFGIPLDGGPGIARILDSDGGRYDRDVVFDRAVGPMQFIPGTWKAVGTDGNGDGKRDPQNMTDAAASSGVYLCSGPGDLTSPADLTRAILRYNNSMDYVRKVTSIAASYRNGTSVIPASPLPSGWATRTPYLPPAHSGPSTRPAGTGASTAGGPAPSPSASAAPAPGGGAPPARQPQPGPQPAPPPGSAPPPRQADPPASAPAPRPRVPVVSDLVDGLTGRTTPAPAPRTGPPPAPSPTPSPSPAQKCTIDALGIKVCLPIVDDLVGGIAATG